MTPKEVFLRRIKDQIKALQDAYEHNKALPDAFFEGLSLNGYKTNEPPPQVKEPETDYGRNKKLILQILRNANRALLTKEIEKEFKKLINSEKDESKAVNNTLSALQDDKDVIGYKPAEFKIRGLFYTLAEWWVADNLKISYRPIEENYKTKNTDNE